MATNRSKKTQALGKAAKEFVTLAHTYDPDKHTIAGWLASEKLDGVRARWINGKLYSRYQKEFPVPQAILDKIKLEINDVPADGELYAGRGTFQKLVSIVKNSASTEADYATVAYHVFDVVDDKLDYKSRMLKYLETKDVDNPEHFVKIVEFNKVNTVDDVVRLSDEIFEYNGEGLILRNPNVPYIFGRTKNLLKVKMNDTMEVEVIDHQHGEGRNEGRLGALICKTDSGRIVKVGSGLSDDIRNNPPDKGTIITIAYMGLTDLKVPRHPTFLAVRNYE